VKLLFDQNLSHKLVTRLADLYPGSDHVRNRGLKEADDGTIWAFAKREQFVIVTKDEDFHARSMLHGHSPKLFMGPQRKLLDRAGRNTAAKKRR
jgi:predicted nuclease of predicted toxin-antitoxin system